MKSQPLATFLRQEDAFLDNLSHIYRSLSTVAHCTRVCLLKPGKWKDDIHVELQTIDIEKSDDEHSVNIPAYEAVSYTWGDMSRTKRIFVEGYPYNVTYNQHALLRRFRRSDVGRLIWIDVISINQADLVERSWQVGLMEEIYSCSTGTQIWIGEPSMDWLAVQSFYRADYDEDDYYIEDEAALSGMPEPSFHDFEGDELHDWMRGAVTLTHKLAEESHLYELPCWQRLGESGRLFVRPGWKHIVHSLIAIMEQPWWTRVWVLQEALLSSTEPTAHVGDLTVPLKVLLDAFTFLVSHNYAEATGCPGCVALAQPFAGSLSTMQSLRLIVGNVNILADAERSYRQNERSLGSMLAMCRGRDATDPRDYVYGLIGIMHPSDRTRIDTDRKYGKYDVSVAQVFAEATFTLIQGYEIESPGVKSLRCLQDAVGTSSEDPYGLASWSTDWTYGRWQEEGQGKALRSSQTSYPWIEQEQGVRSDVIKFNMERMELTVPAACIGTIEAVSVGLNEDEAVQRSDSTDIDSVIARWKTFLESQLQYEPEGGNDVNDLLWRLVAKNADEDEKMDADVVQSWIEQYDRGANGLSIMVDTDDSEFEYDIVAEVNGYSLFRTSQSQFGIGPFDVQAGDQVYVISGCQGPFVLRLKQPSEERKHALVGCCYVHDLPDQPNFGTEITDTVLLV